MPSISIEKNGPDFFLKRSNALAQCRLGDVEAIGRLAEMQIFGNGDKTGKRTNIHEL